MSLLHRLLTWLDTHPTVAWVFQKLYRLIHPPPTRFDVHFCVLGFPIRVHPGFWIPHVVIATAVATADFVRSDPWWPLAFVLCFPCTVCSVLAHELGHALAGRRVGVYGEIVLVSFGGFVRWTHVGYALNLGCCPSRRQRVLIFLGGPAINLVVAAVALAAWMLMGSAGEIYREIVHNPYGVPQSLVGCTLLELLVLVLAGVNLAAGAGNLIPIPRLDGWWISLEVIGWIRTRGRPSWEVDDPEWWSRV